MDVECVGEQTALSLMTHAYSGKELNQYPEFIHALLLVKRACAWANNQLGIVSDDDFERIDMACADLMQDEELFCADVLQGGGGIAVHMNISEAICQYNDDYSLLDEVNASQSTTDVCSTALSLALGQHLEECTLVLSSLIAVLDDLAEEHMDVETKGRTCLRDAGMLPYGERFRGFASLFSRQQQNLERFSNYAYSNLGATALGTGEGIAPAYRAAYSELAWEKLVELTEIPIRLHPDFIDSIQNRDDLFDCASCIESIAVSLLKMAKDLRLLASGPHYGFNEIELPQLIKGSSFYNQKINPTLEETVIQMCFSVLGLVKSAKLGIEHSELDMNIYYLYSSIALIDALRLFNQLVPKYIEYNLTQLIINRF